MTPDRFRLIVSRVLIVGVTTSAILLAAGFVGSLLVGWEGSLTGAAAGAGPATDFGTLLADLLAVRPIALAQAGLVVLVATPVVRVAASVVAFTLEGDRLYAGITVIVLAILLASLFVLR
jgi:uncharacterized membrane protein